MRIIPVIDICQGQVVHAAGGDRDCYLPVHSRLCPGSNPITIVQAFLDLYPFDTVYMADLDALSGKIPNDACLQSLLSNFPRLHFWLDQGFNNKNDILNHRHDRLLHVIGSESGCAPPLLAELLEITPQPILSLDFKKARLLGAQELLLKPELWPENIILMDLDAVGTGSGIKEDLLRNILRTARNRQVFIGGGVRDIAEVRNLKSRGVAGVLVATALHTGQISASCLYALMDSQKKMPR